MSEFQIPDPSPSLSTKLSLHLLLENTMSSLGLPASEGRPFKEIKILDQLGPEAQKETILELLQSIDLGHKNASNGNKGIMLIELIKEYNVSDSFLSYFPEILAAFPQKYTQILSFLEEKLTTSIMLTIALSLYLSDRQEFSSLGQKEIISKLKTYQGSQNGKLPERLVEELLFQIGISPELSSQLYAETKVLLESAEKMNKNAENRIYNYFRLEWQYFANEVPIVEKAPQIILHKSEVLRNLGPLCTQQPEILKGVIAEIGPFTEEDVFEAFFMMAEEKEKVDNTIDRFVTELMFVSHVSSSKKPSKADEAKKLFPQANTNAKTVIKWNIDNFINYCIQNTNIKWQNVFNCFDREGLVFKSEEHFAEIMKIFDKIKRIGKKWVVNESILFKKWVNTASQAEFLYRLFSCKEADCMFFIEPSHPKKKEAVPKDPNNTLREIWAYMDLVELLFEVSEHKRDKIKELLTIPTSKYPDLFIKTLSEIKQSKGCELLNESYKKILPNFLNTNSESIKIVEYLWHSNKELLLQMINELYLEKETKNKNSNEKSNPSNVDIQKIVEIFECIEGSLEEIIMESEVTFALPLSLAAGKKEKIKFEKWLIHKIENNEQKFSKEIITYLEEKLFKPVRNTDQSEEKEKILEEANLSVEILNKIFTIFLEKLKKESPNSKQCETFKKLHKECCSFFPEVAEGQITEEAEKLCEEEIKKIYKEEISIEEAVQNLKTLKNSNKKEEKEQFANRITFLLIELTYHHSYPERELMITAELFSELIVNNLLEKKILQVFLHVISENLYNDDQKYAFTVKVMERIKDRLAQETWFCEKLVDNPLVMKKNPELVEQIFKCIQPPTLLSVEKEKQIREAIKKKNAPIENIRQIIVEPETMPRVISQKNPIDFDILSKFDLTKSIQIAEKEAKTRQINTIFNTLSTANIEEKCQELKKLLETKNNRKFVAHNVFFKRIITTHNNMLEVYKDLALCLPHLMDPIMHLTYKTLNAWFSLEGKTVNDRKLAQFKNIGAWLGKLTIARGFPVPIHHLPLKQILIYTYRCESRIMYNMPVILKILEGVQGGQGQGGERGQRGEGGVQGVWMGRVLRGVQEIMEAVKDEQLKAEIKAFFRNSKIDLEKITSLPSVLKKEEEFSLLNLSKMITLNNELISFGEKYKIPNLLQLVSTVLTHSIEDISESVVHKSIKIAKATAKSVILKDFACEGDIEKLKECAINITKDFSANLALVSCRENIRKEIGKNLKESLTVLPRKVSEEEFESVLQNILTENLDLLNSIIRQNILQLSEKSIKEDLDIHKMIEHRNYFDRAKEPFRDEEYLSKIPGIVPEDLLPTPLPEEILKIYSRAPSPLPLRNVNNSGSMTETLVKMIKNGEPVDKIQKIINEGAQFDKFEVAAAVSAGLVEDDLSIEPDSIETWLQLCSVLKGHIDQATAWESFKQLADFHQESTVKLTRLLVKEKYFDGGVLGEIKQEENRARELFNLWLSTSESSILPFINNLYENLSQSWDSVKYFFYYVFKYVIEISSKENAEISQSYVYKENGNAFPVTYDYGHVDQFVILVLRFYFQSKEKYAFYVEQILEGIVDVFLKLGNDTKINLQRVFVHIFCNLLAVFNEESAKNELAVQKNATLLTTIAKSLLKLCPLSKPSFTLGYLQIVCHKNLIRFLLEDENNWEYYYHLYAQILKFMKECISEENLTEKENGHVYESFYKGVLKLTLSLIHDFPCFLAEYCLVLSLNLPLNFLQLRNMITSAYKAKNEIPLPQRMCEKEREQLLQLSRREGWPKFRGLLKVSYNFNAPVSTLVSQLQNDIYLVSFVVQCAYTEEHSLSQKEIFEKLKLVLKDGGAELQQKLITTIVDLIRAPNEITLFFIDFFLNTVFDRQFPKPLRENLFCALVARMHGVEEPICWGHIYVVYQMEKRKEELAEGIVERKLVDAIWPA